MTVTIDLTPEMEAKLREKALDRGQDIGSYLLDIACHDTKSKRVKKTRPLTSLALAPTVSIVCWNLRVWARNGHPAKMRKSTSMSYALSGITGRETRTSTRTNLQILVLSELTV
jgi:hypothetical protein